MCINRITWKKKVLTLFWHSFITLRFVYSIFVVYLLECVELLFACNACNFFNKSLFFFQLFLFFVLIIYLIIWCFFKEFLSLPFLDYWMLGNIKFLLSPNNISYWILFLTTKYCCFCVFVHLCKLELYTFVHQITRSYDPTQQNRHSATSTWKINNCCKILNSMILHEITMITLHEMGIATNENAI